MKRRPCLSTTASTVLPILASRRWRPSAEPGRRCRRAPPRPRSSTRTPLQRITGCTIGAVEPLLASPLHGVRASRRSPVMEDVVVTPEHRARAVRARLPGQMLHERLEHAALAYGPLYALLEPIESYRERIPDHALLKYDDAVQSGLFDKFWVATPTYYQKRQVDPWIVAEVGGADRWAVIARWD